MKKLLAIAMLAASLVGARAQTNTPQGFLNSFMNYFTAHNLTLTNTFGAHKGEAWTSMDSVQGNGGQAKLLDALGFQYSVYDHLSLENVLRTSGIAGTIATEQFGLGLNFVIIDTKITFYADGGYDIEKSRLAPHSKFKDDLFGELGVRGKKALTENTFAGLGMGVRLPDAAQVYQILVGFTF